MKTKTNRRFFKRPAAIAAAAAIVVLGAGTALAAANNFWSEGSKQMIQADPAQQQELEEQGAATVFDSSMAVTKDGITIEPKEMVVDSRNARITFMISGIDEDVLTEKGKDIMFNWVDYDISHLDRSQWWGSGSLYREVSVLEDGSVQVDSVVDNDGMPAMEYIFSAGCYDEDGIIGKTLHISFEELGMSYEKAGGVTDFISHANWDFDIELAGEDTSVTFPQDQLIYEPYTVTSIEISPLSMRVNYDVDGQVELYDDYNVPVFWGLRMKDGSVLNLGSELNDGMPVFFRDLGKCIYKNGLDYTLDEDERLFPVAAYATVEFNTVVNPDDITEVILQPWGQAYPYSGVSKEDLLNEFDGEIPFEPIDPDNMELFYISLE